MLIDTLSHDSVPARPLPKWLIDQKAGLNTTQPMKIWMKEDHSLSISLGLTGMFILLVVAILSIYIFRKHKNHK
jgi:hypothetical protein